MSDRLFVGVPLSTRERRDLADFLRLAFPDGLPGRTVPAENWHITLRFLGAVERQRAARLERELAATKLGTPFAFRLGPAGAFPSPARARVVWVGVAEGEDQLRALADAVEDAARRAGFEAEKRPFSPHLTLARLRTPLDLRHALPHVSPPAPAVEVREVVLFRSHLEGPSPRYEIGHRFPL